MNGSYYKSTEFPENLYRDTSSPEMGSKEVEESYIENILRLNKGKKATVYMSYSSSLNYKDKIYTGIIEQAGRDHIILSDPNTGKWYLLLMIYLDYIEFDDKINYK